MAKNDNQTEGEFFAIVGTGRKGAEDMLEKMAPEIKTIAAPNVAKNLDTWTKRALVMLTSNQDIVEKCLNSRAGLLSVYQGLAKAATMGMQAGGNFPHFYLVPKEGKAVFVPTATGLSFAAAHGPGAVLVGVPQLVRVYENDGLTIDQAAGTYEHKFDPRKERGKLSLYLMRLVFRDGHCEIPYISAEKVMKISNAYSTKEFSTGKKAPSWVKSEDEMLDKIAAKQLLKKAAAEAEGLAMLMTAEDYALGVDDMPEPEIRDVSERVASRVDAIIEGQAEQVEPESEKEPTEKSAQQAGPATEQATGKSEDKQIDIF